MTGGLIAILAMASVATASGISRPCLDRPSAQALIVVSLPDAVLSARNRCKPVLPATASLTQAGEIMAARWKADAEAAMPTASRALDTISRIPLTSMLGPDAARRAAAAAVSRAVAERLTPADCAAASEVIDAVSPLPAGNVARVFLALADRSPDRNAFPFKLCPSKG